MQHLFMFATYFILWIDMLTSLYRLATKLYNAYINKNDNKVLCQEN
jgi:hypothetical protein